MTRAIVAERKRIAREIERLEKQLDSLKKQERKPVIAEIVRKMVEFSIEPEDIAAAYSPRRGSSRRVDDAPISAATAPAPPKKVRKGKPAAIKYRNEATGETWTGRGLAPRWLTQAEKEGASREDFLIKTEETEEGAPASQEAPQQEETQTETRPPETEVLAEHSDNENPFN